MRRIKDFFYRSMEKLIFGDCIETFVIYFVSFAVAWMIVQTGIVLLKYWGVITW